MKKPNFTKSELVPTVIQDFETREILMLGYMNSEAFEKTLTERRVTFYSRSKERLWTKGETSGNFLNLISWQTDCDQDVILIQAKPQGPTCHTGQYSCFPNVIPDQDPESQITQTEILKQVQDDKVTTQDDNSMFLKALFDIIKSRKDKMPKGSYTTSLFEEGINKICLKVSEEAAEVVKAATKEKSKERIAEESADLLYHLMVLLVNEAVELAEVVAVLKKRH